MEYIKYAVIALVVIFFIRRLMPVKGVRQISVAELKKELHDKNKQFIDVRTASEFKSRNIRSFKNLPLHQLQRKASELVKDKEVILICQSGMRSSRASKLLRKQGFEQVTNVKGGMSAWQGQ